VGIFVRLGSVPLAAALVFACGAEPRAGRVGDDTGSGVSGGPGIIVEDPNEPPPPPPPGTEGYCGNQIIKTKESVPNLYFVVDRSESMDEKLPGSAHDRYTNARLAIANLLRVVGHRVRYGAAVFPSRAGGCSVGQEVFTTRAGDPVNYAAAEQDGPQLRELMSVLAVLGTSGGTPTGPTLAKLEPTLLSLKGETIVILATDGQPNCNPAARCATEDCYYTLLAREGNVQTVNGKQCTVNVNCCDPKVAPDGPLQCIDGESTAAAAKRLAQAGIRTFVIGMPGSTPFEDVLDRIALAGGTGREAPPHYYPVGNASELTDVLRQIGTSVVVSCDFELTQEPPDPKLVNVYFDASVVPSGGDGWVWTGDRKLQLRGDACRSVMNGDVLQVQVVAGCPTQVQ
jgi:hypothetical protein